jgi:hypothetical protein
MAIAKLSIDLEARLAKYETDMKRVVSLSEQTAGRIESAFGGVALMFTGLAGALSVGALKGAFDKYVEGAAALDDFGEIVGSTTEKVSGLSAVAKISGTDLGLLQGGMVKLAKSMTEVSDKTSGAGAAFAALGIDPEELKLLDTSDAFKQLADRLNEYEDGATKTALATALLGKSGAQLLPYMKDLAETGDLVAKVTTEQGAAAEEYEKNLKRLAAAQGAVAKIISAEVLPVANEFVKTLVDMITKTDGVTDATKGMAKDGSITEWAKSAARAAAFVIDSFDGVQRVVKGVGITIAAIAAQAAFLAKGNLAGYKSVGAEWRKDLEDIASKPQFSDGLEARLAAMSAGGATAAPGKKKLSFAGGGAEAKPKRGGKAGAVGKESVASFTDYDEQVLQRIAGAIEKTDVVKAAELVKQLETLDKLAAAGLDPAIVKAVRDDLTGASKIAADELARLNSMLAVTDSSKLEIARKDMLLLTDALTSGRIAEQQYLEAVTARLDGTAGKSKEAASEVNEFAKQAAQNIQSTLADFLFDPFAEGSDKMLQKFGQTIQRMAADAAAAQIGKALFGDMGSGKTGGDSGLVGAGVSALSKVNWAALFSFDGGGSTGSGSRSGGVDGKGGFPAILHPNETVVDHTKGQRMGGNNITIQVNSPTGDSAEIRRSAAAGARSALGFMGGARRYA